MDPVGPCRPPHPGLAYGKTLIPPFGLLAVGGIERTDRPSVGVNRLLPASSEGWTSEGRMVRSLPSPNRVRETRRHISRGKACPASEREEVTDRTLKAWYRPSIAWT